jgi:hypothetical protein
MQQQLMINQDATTVNDSGRLTFCAVRLWRELIRHRQSDCLCRRFLFLVAFPAERDQLGPDCLVKGEPILDKHVKTGRINDRNGFRGNCTAYNSNKERFAIYPVQSVLLRA